MIPYEDLVYALNEWRAQKGLPTNMAAAPARTTGPAPAAPPPVRAAPPAPPPVAAASWGVVDAPTSAQPQLEYPEDAFSIEGEEYVEAGEASDAMQVRSARPGTQPGIAPGAGGPPGQRR